MQHHSLNTTSAAAPALHEPRPTTAVRAHAWDLADAGVHEVLEELRGAGIDGLHLAYVARGGRYYCPHNPRHALVHVPDGLVYFQPDLDRYGAIKPRVHPGYASSEFSDELREACAEHGVTLVAWAPLFGNGSLTEWHPEAACVNALDDRLAGALCPAHPDVRAYATGLVRDLAQGAGAQIIELQDFAYPLLDRHRGAENRAIPLPPSLAFLLGLCFCPHCRARAEQMNIEVTDLKRRAERMIRQGLAGDLSERRLSDEISDAGHPLTRYGTMRAVTITTLLDELLHSAEGSDVALQPLLNDAPQEAWRSGIELRRLRERVHLATLVAPAGAEPAAVHEFLEDYQEQLDMGNDLAADLRLASLRQPWTDATAETDWRALAEAAHEAGCARLVLTHYGLASQEELETLSHATRRA